MIRRPPRSTRTDTLFPYTTLFRSKAIPLAEQTCLAVGAAVPESGEVEFDQGTISDVLPNRRKIGGIEQAHTDGVETGQQRLTLSLRSEEHTSELQSLMRISYAVFCLKKKKTRETVHKINTIS